MAYDKLHFVLAVQSLRPGLQPRIDFVAEDIQDGKGPFISSWTRMDVKEPTKAEIEAVDTALLLMAQKEILIQNLFEQFTVADFTKIQTALAGVPTFAPLWYSLLTHSVPIVVGTVKFKTQWTALVGVLGQSRMTTIAAALGVVVQ